MDNATGLHNYKNDKNVVQSQSTDRLSELPEFLILEILSLLPITDVVRTTILSKRWVDLWTTVPCLIFKENIEYAENLVDYKSDTFVNFVNRALALWKGNKIQKFTIICVLDACFTGCVDKWLDVALKHGVEELILHIDLVISDDVFSYVVPQQLYSCSSMRELLIVGCGMKINGDVHWDKLKSLTTGGVGLKEHEVDQVLSGCPQLEVLDLHLLGNKSHLNIHSRSLKKLIIGKSERTRGKDTTLTIWAPNVETLVMWGAMYCKYLLKNVSSLANVTLSFFRRNFNHDDYDDDDNDDEMLISRKETLMQVFQSVRHVENFTLSDQCIQVLGERNGNQSTLQSDAKFLKLYVDNVVKHNIVNLLKMFPKLIMLFLEHVNVATCEEEEKCIIAPYFVQLDEENLLESKKYSQLHLRTIHITWTAGDSSLTTLIEILQKYTGKVEEMVIRPIEIKQLPPRSLSFGSTEN